MFEEEIPKVDRSLSGAFAFKLYDTFGFPIDLTQLLCAERNLKVDMDTFNQLMEQQRELGRQARTQQMVRAADIATSAVTEFTGFQEDQTTATILEIHRQEDAQLVIPDRTPFYAEMGGQLGDQGTLTINGTSYPVSATQQIGTARAHSLPLDAPLQSGDVVALAIDPKRRRPIEAHHTATHLLHWALHKHISPDAAQQGSLVSRKRLRFDFNSSALSAAQIEALENTVNRCIESGDPVSWQEVPFTEVSGREDIEQFFGDKYGDRVRVVQIGGQAGALDGYSMELCGGTHVANTSEVGLFKIKSESAIAAGIRRIEAVCGEAAYDYMIGIVERSTEESKELRKRLQAINRDLEELEAEPINYPEFPHIMTGMLDQGNFEQKNAVFNEMLAHLDGLRSAVVEADKALKKAQTAGAARMAASIVAELDLEHNLVITAEGPGALTQEILNQLKSRQYTAAAFCIVDDGERLHLGALAGANARSQAGELMQTLAPVAGGKGGGKPDLARGAAPERDKLADLAAAARKELGLPD
jgi:alanyl-tRNA synthetase